MTRSSSPLSLEFILLGFLHQQPAHGYELYKILASPRGAALVWRVKQARLYALLERLEAEGLITARLIAGETRPDRREYSITPAGLACFQAWRSAPVPRSRDMRQEFMAKLYFSSKTRRAGILPAENIQTQLIDAQIKTCNGWITAIDSQLTALGAKETFERAVLGYRLAQARTALSWLESTRAELEGGK